MPSSNKPEDLTPAATPDAKKSSGAWKFKFNSPDAICGRCPHRRDEHEAEGLRCMLCDCPRFVVGGPDYDAIPDTEPAPEEE